MTTSADSRSGREGGPDATARAQRRISAPAAARALRTRAAAVAASAALVVAGSLVYVTGFSTAGPAAAARRAGGTPRAATVRMLTCAGKTVVKPVGFVISCADANSELTATHWTSWNARGAVGTTRFGLNLCIPYCAASRMSYFPRSTVRLSAPVPTKHGRLFSKLVVAYRLHGKTRKFDFSWVGIPAFAK